MAKDVPITNAAPPAAPLDQATREPARAAAGTPPPRDTTASATHARIGARPTAPSTHGSGQRWPRRRLMWKSQMAHVSSSTVARRWRGQRQPG